MALKKNKSTTYYDSDSSGGAPLRNDSVYSKTKNTTTTKATTTPAPVVESGVTPYSKVTSPTSYSPSSRVNYYSDMLQDYEDSEPASYSSRYDSTIQSILDTINNRGAFDINSDTNYQQLFNNYKERYTSQAQKAMRDTMASAQASSGGYGNTYAQIAGQQAYDNTMQGLNDQNINLMNLAYQMYGDTIANDYNKLAAFQGQDNIDYSRYRDTYNDWYNNRNYYANQYQNEYSNDYGQYRDTISDTNNLYANALSYASNGYSLPSYISNQLSDSDNAYFANIASQALAKANSVKSSGGTKKSNTEQSKNYSTVATQAKGMSNESKAQNYINQSIANGLITEDEGSEIMALYWGTSLNAPETNVSNNNSNNGAMSDSKNYTAWVDVLNECERTGKTSDAEIEAALKRAGVDENRAIKYRDYILQEEARIARSK